MVMSIPPIGVPHLLDSETLRDALRRDVDALDGSVYWDHQEQTGSVLGAYNSALAVGRDVALGTYGDYTAGANWANSSAEIARHSAGSVETLQQDDILAAGKTYQVTITVANRTAGSVTITDGGAAIATNGETTRTITSTGTDFIITPHTDFDGDIDVAILLVQQTGILASSAYADPANNPLSGADTGTTVGQFASGALGLARLDDGATSYSEVYSAEINSMWNPDAFTLMILGKTDAWEDSTVRRLITLASGDNNRIGIQRHTGNDNMAIVTVFGGTKKEKTDIDLGGTLGWFLIAVTCDTGADALKFYINDAQVGSTLTGLGTWVGNLLSTDTVFGASTTTPGNVWDGYRTHVAYFPEVKDAGWFAQKAKEAGVYSG